MKLKLLAPLALVLLAACDGNPLGTTDVPVCDTNCPVGADDPVTIPPILAKNLQAIAYDETSDSFRITFKSLDTTPTIATWSRRATLDLVGYRAYVVQEDPLDRMFVGLAKTSTDGSVTAIAAGDGGQFNRVFQGGTYGRTGGFDRPTSTDGAGSGQVSYAGTYAAVTNIGAPRPGEILPVPPNTSGELVPDQPSRVRGDIFINANFTDNSVNGAIYNRVLVEANNFGLQAVILVPTDIEANGTFTGTTERWVNDDPSMTTTGDYGGVFGGVDSAAVGGVVALTKLYRTDTGALLPNALEQGVFVLQQCGTAGDAAICSQVAPTNP